MTSIKTPRPIATILTITQQAKDSSRSLHFRTDQGPVVIRVTDPKLLREFGEMISAEANTWVE